MYSSFVKSILHIILHGLMFIFFCSCFFFDITWCMHYRDYGLCFGGGSYSSVYVPPPLYIFPLVLVVYIPSFFPFLLCFVYLFLNSHMPQVLLFPICVSFIHTWMKTFGGCMHMHFIICSYMCILRYVYLIYFIIFDVISQDSTARHVIL